MPVSVGSRRLLSLVLLAIALATLAGVLASGKVLQRVDLIFYDTLIRLQYRPPPADITIVAIDEKSLQQLGRWPWSRRLHAELIDRLKQLGARAVAFDVLMPEPETSDATADQALAEAMARHGRVVLAVAPEPGTGGRIVAESLPIPELAAAAAGLGHVDAELDVDGLCRSVFLYAGLGTPLWPNLGLSLVQAAFPSLTPTLASERRPTGAAAPDLWARDHRTLIPFAGPTGHFRRVSYVDVLQGQVAEEAIRERLVLVGATAAGLGDALATPASTDRKRMPGVEMHANLVNAVLEGIGIREVPPGIQLAATVLLVFLAVSLLAWVPRYEALYITGAVLLVLATAAALLLWYRLWWPPSAAITAVLLSFPLWSWLQRKADVQALLRLQHRMEHHARHDPVTGLPNHELLREYMSKSLQEGSGRLGLLCIHFERRGVAGQGLGLSGSEWLSRAVADILRNALREADMVVYLNNDEFAVVIEQPPSPVVLQATGGRLHEAFAEALSNGGAEVYLTPRIGASLYPEDGADARTLIDNAFTAMFKARESEEKDLCWFTPDLREEMRSRSELENLLQHAVRRGELELHYQPQVRATDGELIGVEALARWNNPKLGRVGPDVFIPVAERTGRILQIGDWVLECACRQVRAWDRLGLGSLRLSVNLSPVQFVQDDLVERIMKILRKTDFPADQLELEITEGALLRDLEAAVATLAELKRNGIRIAIDDFGTGYSSLSYLKRFPLDRLKIDRSFIVEIGRDSDSGEITQAIIDMAHRLRLEVIAEGVEHYRQARFLESCACDEIQGYLYGKPVPAVELENLLVRRLGLQRTAQADNVGPARSRWTKIDTQ